MNTMTEPDIAEIPEGREEGFMWYWVLWWTIILLFIGGIGIDLFSVLAVRRSLVGQAEAAAAAGGVAIAEELFREEGVIELDFGLAEVLAIDNLSRQAEAGLVESVQFSAFPASQEFGVTLTGTVEFTLIKIFLPGEPPIEIQVTALSGPRVG